MEKHKVAVWQIHCGPDSQPEKNLNKIVDCLRQSTAQGARLILFPELSISGYTVEKKDVFTRLRATTPAMIEKISRIAAELHIGTVVGLFEEAPVSGKAYNVSLAISPDGRKTRYRKSHIPPNEKTFASGEQRTEVADFGFVRLGLSTCFDNWFPETARVAYLRGADMLHMPFYWPAEWETKDDLPRKRVPFNEAAVLSARRSRILKVFPSRALDNGLYITMVDQAARNENPAEALPGKSMVFDPYGDIIAETRGWEEEVLYFEFDPGRVREWRESAFFPGNHLRLDIYARVYEYYSKSRK